MQRLTEEQRTQWAVDGYLCIEGALKQDEVEFFSSEIDRFRKLPGWNHYQVCYRAVIMDGSKNA